MRILSIESSTHFGGVALEDGATLRTAGPFPSRSASREFLGAARGLLGKAGLEPGALDLLSVSTGPGLFTGLRLGLSIAKTLAWSLGPEAPALVGVPTLEAVAALALDEAKPGDHILAATDARRGELYAALFTVGGNEALEARGADLVLRPEALHERLLQDLPADTRLWVTGDAARRYGQTLTARLPAEARLLEPEPGLLAPALGRRGRRRLEAGEADAPFALRPHYVRRPDARLPRADFF